MDISRSANAAAAVELPNLFHTITGYQVGNTTIEDGGDDLYDGNGDDGRYNANSWTVNGVLLKYKDNGDFGNVGGQEYSMDIVTNGLSVVLFDNASVDILLYGPNNNMGADRNGQKYLKNFNHKNWSVYIDVITDAVGGEAGEDNDPSHMVVVLVERVAGVEIKAVVAPFDDFPGTTSNTDYQDIRVTGALGARVIYLQGALKGATRPEQADIINALTKIATSVIDLHYA